MAGLDRKPTSGQRRKRNLCQFESEHTNSLLRREPVLVAEGANEAGKEFFNQFAEDCDLKGSNLSDFFRQQLVNTLVYGRSYVALDFPRFPEAAPNRAAGVFLEFRTFWYSYPGALL